jgi:hypothetical protein
MEKDLKPSEAAFLFSFISSQSTVFILFFLRRLVTLVLGLTLHLVPPAATKPATLNSGVGGLISVELPRLVEFVCPILPEERHDIYLKAHSPMAFPLEMEAAMGIPR